MSDYIVRATAADANIRAFAVTSREMVETAREDHMTTPVMTAALGRLLSAGAMMGAMMKGDKDIITLQIQCSGPAKGLTVTADSHGNVKGFAMNPHIPRYKEFNIMNSQEQMGCHSMLQASSMWVERLILEYLPS